MVRRAAAWPGGVLVALLGCGFPAHEFTNDLYPASGKAGSAGVGAQHAAGSSIAVESGGAGSKVNTSSGGVRSEVCDNRVDDDGDGRIDCSDADCIAANWLCLPAIPSGAWRGPIAIATAKAAALLPECQASGGYRTVVSSGWCSQVSPSLATCASCPTCGTVLTPKKAVTLDLGIDCSASCITWNPTDCRKTLDEGCMAVELAQSSLLSNAILAQLTVRVQSPVVSGGSCQSALTKGTLAAPLEGTCLEPMKICSGPATGSCASGGSCILRPQAPYSAVPCIYFEGAQTSCPTGWDSVRQIAYTNVVDTRACTDCSCNPASSSAYSGASAMVVDYVQDATCQGGSGRAGTGSFGCLSGFDSEFPANAIMTRYFKVSINAPQASCVQGGGQAVGSVETQAPVTICCTSL